MKLSAGKKHAKEGVEVRRETPRVVLYVDNASGFGGSMNSLKNTLRGLDATRFRAVLVTGHQSGNPSDGLATYQVSYNPYYRFIPSFRDRINKSFLPVFARKVINGICFGCFLIAKESRYFLSLWKISRAHNPSLIHLNNNVNSQLSGIFLARILRIPCISHQRDYESRSFITGWLTRWVDCHIAISGSIKDNLVMLGVKPAKVWVVPDCVDVEEWKPNTKEKCRREVFGIVDGARLVGIFGRVVPWKGQHVFVRAMQEVCKVSPDVRGFIVGDESHEDSSYMQEVAQQAQRLELDSRILMTGYRHDVRDLMSMMDVVVHASTRPEPFGMVIIEAMAMGKPVIATEGGGPSEIITHGTSGILVPRGDSESLASAICMLLEDPTHAKELGEAGRRVVLERFTSTQQAQEIMQIYRSLLNG